MAAFNGQRTAAPEGSEGLPNFFSQPQVNPSWSCPGGLEFAAQGESSHPRRPWLPQHGDDDFNFNLDLNSQAPEHHSNNFPHLEVYQDLLQSGSGELGNGGRGNGVRGGRTWCPPRQSGAGGRGGRGRGGNNGGRGTGGNGGGRGAAGTSVGSGTVGRGGALSASDVDDGMDEEEDDNMGTDAMKKADWKKLRYGPLMI